MESRHLQETLPVFHVSPRTLQEMTASQCALNCWINFIMMGNNDSDEIRSTEWLEEQLLTSFSCTDIAPFPVGVRFLIDHKIRLIGKELSNWFNAHSFLELSPGVIANCVVLQPAGDICYKRTAKNLLTANPAFTFKRQFEIACKYCIEEDVQRSWFLVSRYHHNFDYPSNGFGVASLDLVGVTDYWCSKMRGELREFYKKANEEQERSPEWFVLSNHRRKNITNWAQVEYFWHKLNREEQSSLVGNILLDKKFTKHLILKLDEEMLENLSILDDLTLVFKILAEDELCYESALQVWSYKNAKNIMIEYEGIGLDYEYRKLADFSHMAFRNPNFHGFHISSLLGEMWLSASIDFKNYVLCHHLKDLFERSLQCVDTRSFGCDVGFFIELLSSASLEIRQQIWRRWWRKFFLLAQVSDILKIMTLCFHNADDIVQFKKKYMMEDGKLRGIFTEFIKQGLFDEFIEYLKFCCSDDEDEKLVREARKKLALEHLGDQITGYHSEPIFCKFLRFFHDSVSSADLAEMLNWEFQDKEANLLSLCILFDEGGLDIFNIALRCFEFSDQRLIELKRFFYEQCQRVLMSGDFNSFFVRDWEELLIWCTSSAEIVNRLRDSIAIDDLFKNFLVSMRKFFMDCRDTPVVKYRYSDRSVVFLSINGLLRWYFRDRGGVTAKQFKYDKIIGYENSEAMKMLLSMENDEILRDVLLWFFDHDSCKLKKFLVQFVDENFSWKGVWNVIKSSIVH